MARGVAAMDGIQSDTEKDHGGSVATAEAQEDLRGLTADERTTDREAGAEREGTNNLPDPDAVKGWTGVEVETGREAEMENVTD